MKKILVSLLVLVLCFTAFANGAEETSTKTDESNWPSGAVQLIVPTKAGGGTDLVARVLSAELQKILGETVIVSNITDGSGAVAYSTVMNDDEDALKLGFVIPSFFTAYITGATKMNPKTEFQCATFLELTDCNYFVVAQNSKFKTMKELMDYVKAHPGEVTLGLSIGSRTHFTVAEFAKAAGLEFKYVQAGNAADQVTALLGGHIDVTYLNIANTKSNVEAGKMRALASQCPPAEEIAALKGVPTFADLGYGDLKCKCDFFVITDKNTSKATIAKINDAFMKACESQEVKDGLLKLGYKAECVPSDQTNAKYLASYETFEQVGELLGVKVN